MKALLTSTMSKEEQFKAPGYVLLHLPHKQLPVWLKAMEAVYFISMPPVVVVASKNTTYRGHSSNPAHSHETWYPFALKTHDGSLTNTEGELMAEKHSTKLWANIFKSSHRAELTVTREERRLVNDAVTAAGWSSEANPKKGKKVKEEKHFRSNRMLCFENKLLRC